jgi:hypothetical protein
MTTIRVEELNLDDYMLGQNNQILIFQSLPYIKKYTSALAGDILISGTLNGKEVADTDIDSSYTGYDFVYSLGLGTSGDGRFKIAITKSTPVKTISELLDKVNDIKFTYYNGTLTSNGTNYIVKIYNYETGQYIKSLPVTMDNITSTIQNLELLNDVKLSGVNEYRITKDYTIS